MGRSSSKAIRSRVVSLPVCLSDGVAHRFPATSSYDCSFSRPLSSGQPLRFEARVEGPVTGGTLLAPFSQRACVYYSANVSQETSDGAQAKQVAFASESRNFRVCIAGTVPVH